MEGGRSEGGDIVTYHDLLVLRSNVDVQMSLEALGDDTMEW